MSGMLTTGEVLQTTAGLSYEVLRLLGAGGQGEVYEVRCEGKSYALKWYFPHTATEEQRAGIEELRRRGSPDDRFLWPQELLYGKTSFGYVMPLRPPQYKSIVDLMKRRAEPSFAALCMCGVHVAEGYRKLHASGYCYRDISFGNLFFDPDTGAVLICDNDNVAVNGAASSAVSGTQRFMAPEIVRGECPPSTDTDLFSLAVLLFYMFMLHHPLEGSLEAQIKCFDMVAMNKIYGKSPLFIWDPQDASNRPVPGYQDNAIVYWQLYPRFLRDLFLQSFTEGLHLPRKRVLEHQWMEACLTLRDSVMYCGRCGCENFYDQDKLRQGVAPHCWNCGTTLVLPPRMRLGNRLVMLNRDSLLLGHHLRNDFDYQTVAAEVVRHPTEPGRWGLRNGCADSWQYTRTDGTTVAVAPGKSAPLANGARIHFGTLTGEIKA